MRLHLRPDADKSAEILHFPNTRAEDMAALAAQLTNMQAALGQRYNPTAARLMLAEAAIRAIAQAARDANSLTATRFAIAIETHNAFDACAEAAGGRGLL